MQEQNKKINGRREGLNRDERRHERAEHFSAGLAKQRRRDRKRRESIITIIATFLSVLLFGFVFLFFCEQIGRGNLESWRKEVKQAGI